MHFLYMIFIYPLELFMKTILEFSYSLTDNYGLSIIILSINVNIMLLPLYYMAEKWKAKDKADQDSMKPEIDNIKKHYKGQERHFYIQTIYRRYGYHPFSSIKASVGFLIQIPFFFAAFHLLSNYQALNGVSFGILKDLGSPDLLMGGINVLPIVMTIFNLLSAYIYIELLNKSEKIQLFALAFIFLVVLYNEPAGLLLYWTMNNVFSLVKNIVEKKFKLGPLFSRMFKKQTARESKVNIEYFSELYKKFHMPIWTFFLISLIGYYMIYTFLEHQQNIFYSVLSLSIFIYLDWILFLKYFNLKNTKTIFKTIILIILIFIMVAYTVYSYRYTFMAFTLNSSSDPLWTVIASSSTYLIENIIRLLSVVFSVMFLIQFFLLLPHELEYRQKINYVSKFNPTVKLFLFTCTSILLLLLIINPMILYLSSPNDFLMSLDDILHKSIIILFISLLICYILYFLSSKTFKTILIIVAINILFIFILYSFFMIKDYGLMDHFVFNIPENLIMSKLEIILETIILFILISIVTYTALVKNKILEIIVMIIFLVLLSFFVFNDTNDTNDTNISTDVNLFLNEVNTTLSLSKNKNILIFFLDGFSGGDLERIFQDKYDLLSMYDGFVRYKNVLTVHNGTWASIPSMFGGKKYTVEEINKRKNETLREKLKEAYNVFATQSILNEWNLTYLYPQFALDLNEKINNPKFDYGKYYLNSLNQRLDRKIIIKNELQKLYHVSLFKTVPWSLKNIVYDEGQWGIKQDSLMKLEYKSHYWGFLNIFEKNMVANSTKKTLKYFQLGIPHGPFAISENGLLSTNSSYYTECYKTLEKLGTIFKEMKKNKIYNNSKIIIVSDHGWWRKNPNFPDNFEDIIGESHENRMSRGMVNPILLVKDFNATGAIRTSNRLMTNADVPAIVCSSKDIECAIDDLDPIKHDLNRTLIISTTQSTDFTKGNIFKVYDQYKVKNNIFDPKNWTKLK